MNYTYTLTTAKYHEVSVETFHVLGQFKRVTDLYSSQHGFVLEPKRFYQYSSHFNILLEETTVRGSSLQICYKIQMGFGK